MKQELSDSSLSDYALFDKTDYRHKRHNKMKIHSKKGPIKLCAKLTEKLLIILYKSKILKFKLDEDLPQRRIYSFTLVESL